MGLNGRQEIQGRKEETGSTGLRTAAVFVTIAGGIVSLALQLYAGRTNKHYYITFIFALWVPSPFAALLWISHFSKRWVARSRRMIGYGMILISLLATTVYVNNLINPRIAQAAFVFVAVPVISWIFVGILAWIASSIARRAGRDQLP